MKKQWGKCVRQRENEERMGWNRRWGRTARGGKVVREYLPRVETLTDGPGSLSNSPRRDSNRSSYTQSCTTHTHTEEETGKGPG